MKKPDRTSPVMEFVFQTIKLDQVATLIPHNYRSKYEAIRTQVIEKIKTMPADETFLFQPQNRKAKLDDNLIARICHGINTGLVRENLNWKISFSDKAKAFVVAPFKRYKIGKRTIPTQTTASSADKKLKMTPDESLYLKSLLAATQKHYGKSLTDLQTKLDGPRNPELASIKKAFVYVGRNAMGIKLCHLGKLLGLASSSTTTMYKRAKVDPKVIEYAKVLSDAVTTNGRGN